MELTEQEARDAISKMRATQREKEALMKKWIDRSQGARSAVLWFYKKLQADTEKA
jgi:hypothetical protein